MRVFVAHSNHDDRVAREIAEKLRAREVEVFIDEDSLPPGESYDDQIRAGIEGCDLFLFLVSEASTTAGTYALTELELARRRWPNPSGRVLPVAVGPIEIEAMPPYITQGITVLRPRGNIATETADRASEMLTKQKRDKQRRSIGFVGVGLLLLLLAGFLLASKGQEPAPSPAPTGATAAPPVVTASSPPAASASATASSVPSTAPPAAEPPIPTGFGRFRNPGEALCLMTTGPWEGEGVLGYSCSEHRQRLKFRDAGRGNFQLVFEHSGMCLTDIEDSFRQQACGSKNTQLFVPHLQQDSPLFTIESKSRRQCLALRSGAQWLTALPCEPQSSALLFEFAK